MWGAPGRSRDGRTSVLMIHALVCVGTPDTHADKAGLDNAMTLIQGLAKLVNETMWVTGGA